MSLAHGRSLPREQQVALQDAPAMGQRWASAIQTASGSTWGTRGEHLVHYIYPTHLRKKKTEIKNQHGDLSSLTIPEVNNHLITIATNAAICQERRMESRESWSFWAFDSNP